MIALLNGRRSLQPGSQTLQRSDRVELGDPRVSHLRQIWGGLADIRSRQFLVRRGPWNLLHVDADAGAPLELRHQLSDHFPLAAEPPELEAVLLGGAGGAGEGQDEENEEC